MALMLHHAYLRRATRSLNAGTSTEGSSFVVAHPVLIKCALTRSARVYSRLQTGLLLANARQNSRTAENIVTRRLSVTDLPVR